MTLPRRLRKWLWKRMMRTVVGRPPDFIIGGTDDPYLLRWWIIPRNRFFNIYLHKFLRSDDDRALHDHPWVNLSILLEGEYLEHTPEGTFYRRPGQMIARRPTSPHRVELTTSADEDTRYEHPVWTLFLTGPRIREWGFLCPQGWRHHTEFNDPNDPGRRGRGCE